jgi:dynein heavy chain
MELLSEARDPRMEFLQEFTLKSLRLKPDKWARMVVSDEQRNFINNFIERNAPQV